MSQHFTANCPKIQVYSKPKEILPLPSQQKRKGSRILKEEEENLQLDWTAE
jgi:hypothetical protein